MSHVALIDLNNFARYPTLSIGYIASILRQSNFKVTVISPLSVGFLGIAREPQAKRFGLFEQRLRFWSAWCAPNWMQKIRRGLAGRQKCMAQSEETKLIAKVRQAIDDGAGAVMISTYLMYFDTCRAIASACMERGIPVLIGGPYFTQIEIASVWAALPGVAGVATGEHEAELPSIAHAMCSGRDLTGFSGIYSRTAAAFQLAAPVRNLDALPFPDFSDFPWQLYPHRIVPVITGRGCGWGACTFCSDVTSGAGRSFRSRSGESVISELHHQVEKLNAKHFVFTDLKLNSDMKVWKALLSLAETKSELCQWIGAVHVGTNPNNGLSETDLQQARKAGMVRVTTGLESGSQRILDNMRKGTSVEVMESFIRHANRAGISVRLTMIAGFQGETASDVDASIAFVERNQKWIDRVTLNRYQIMLGTPDHKHASKRTPSRTKINEWNPRIAALDEYNPSARNAEYRRSMRKLLGAVHEVNCKPLAQTVSVFDGVM